MSTNVRNREVALQKLLNNPNISQVATEIGVNEKTIRRWLQEPEFAAQLTEARRDITQGLIRLIIARSQKSIEVLDEVMSNQKASPYARVQAAKTLLDNALKAIETQEILSRIEELEKTNAQPIEM